MEYGIWNFHGGLWTAVNNLAAFSGGATITPTIVQPAIQNQLTLNGSNTSFALPANLLNPIITAAAACNLNVNEIVQPEVTTYEEETEEEESDEEEDENEVQNEIPIAEAIEAQPPPQMLLQPNPSGFNLVVGYNNDVVVESDEDEDDEESGDDRLEIKEDSEEPPSETAALTFTKSESEVASEVTDKVESKNSATVVNVQRIRYEREEYHCTMCTYTCTTEKAYLRHLRMHSMGETAPDGRLSCTVCGKDRIGESALAKHMKKHRNDRYFCCDICVFKTVQLKKLIQHRRMHTGEKPHLCPHCAYRSARRDNLRSHVRRVHKRENLWCDTFSPRGMLLTPSKPKNDGEKEVEVTKVVDT